jgi:hypothetical protein
MAQFEFSDTEADPAILFEFDRHQNFMQRWRNPVFATSGVAEWADVRMSKFSEIVDPLLMYVSQDMDHHAAWVNHKGAVVNDENQLQSFQFCHVICDCAAETEDDGHPSSIMTCDFIGKVLAQRAGELSLETRITETLAALTEYDETEQDFRLTYLGQELAIRAIAHLLETDLVHPASWVANRRNGLHEIETLATFVGYGTEEVMPLLEIMEEGSILDIRGATVRLTKDSRPELF